MNAKTVAVAKITMERGWKVKIKCLCIVFLQAEDREFIEKMFFGTSYWAIRRSSFARVNALCNLSRRKSQKVAAHFWADF